MWKLAVAACCMALSLFFLIGVGVNGSFTSAVQVQSRISAGTFSIVATPDDPSSTTGGDPPPCIPLSLTSTQGTSLQYQLSNAAPGSTYCYSFSVADTGTISGYVSSIDFTPLASTASTNGATMEIECLTNGQWQTVGAPWPATSPRTVSLSACSQLSAGDGSTGGAQAGGPGTEQYRVLIATGTATTPTISGPAATGSGTGSTGGTTGAGGTGGTTGAGGTGSTTGVGGTGGAGGTGGTGGAGGANAPAPSTNATSPGDYTSLSLSGTLSVVAVSS